MTASYGEVILVSFILILPFLYETSDTFRYYLRFFLYYGLVMFNAVILIPIMALKPRDVRNLLLASTLCKHINSLLGMRWHLRGREYLEKEQACIVVCNHQSSIDVLGMLDIWPVMDKCTVVAKKEIFYAWPFGLAAWLCGLIFIDRVNPEKARIKLKEATDYIKVKKIFGFDGTYGFSHVQIKLWVFPEGTRRNTGDIHPFKKGAFHMAIQAQIPILPIVFSSYYFLDSNKKYFDQGKIIITTLAPISTIGMTNENIDDLINQTRNKMLETFHASSKEVKEELLKPLAKI